MLFSLLSTIEIGVEAQRKNIQCFISICHFTITYISITVENIENKFMFSEK